MFHLGYPSKMFRFSIALHSKGWVGWSEHRKKKFFLIFQSNTIPLNWKHFFHWYFKKYGSVLFSLNGTLKKSGSVGWWETKQLIGVALETKKMFWQEPRQTHVQRSRSFDKLRRRYFTAQEFGSYYFDNATVFNWTICTFLFIYIILY